MCAHNQLFEPAMERARDVIASGVLGDIYMARTVDCFVAGNTAEFAPGKAPTVKRTNPPFISVSSSRWTM